MDREISDLITTVCSMLRVDGELFRKGMIKVDIPIRKIGNGDPYGIDPDFTVPWLPPERPLSLDNKVAFSLSHVFVVKQFDYHAAGNNAAYITASVSREGRKAAASAGKNERYISRDNAVLIVKSPGGENVRALFTNIHPDLKKRVEFWDAISLVEQPPQPSVVTLYPERLPEEMWSEIVESYDAEPYLMRGLLHVQAALYVRPYRHTSSETASVAVRMPKSEYDAFKRHLEQIGAWDEKHPAALITKKGSCGRIQRRLIAELPEGLPPEAMYRVAQKFAEYLAGKGVMYTVVVHAPDSNNDERNFHIHAAISDRRAEFLDELGCWDFEYCVPDKGYRSGFKRPFLKKKNRSLSCPGSGYSKEYVVDVIREIRETYATICNEELIENGVERLFDPRSYEAMGINQKPITRLSVRATLLSYAGIPTARDAKNAELSWQGVLDRFQDDIQQLQKERHNLGVRAEGLIAAARHDGLNSASLKEAERQLVSFKALMSEVEPREWPIALLHVAFWMADSRAGKVEAVCQRLLNGIDAGVARASIMRSADKIRERQKAAMAHSDHLYLTAHKAIEAVDIQADVNKLGILVSELSKLLQTLEIQIKVARSATASSQSELNPVEPMPSPEEPAKVEPHPEASADHEEAWERILRKVQDEGLEIELSNNFLEGYRVPALSDEEQELLRHPASANRRQGRLRAICFQRERLFTQDKTGPASEVEADPAPSECTGIESHALQVDQGKLDRDPITPCRYMEALAVKRAQNGLDAQEAAQAWFDDLGKHFRGKPLPIVFNDKDEAIVDVSKLPPHLVKVADGLPEHVNALIKSFVSDIRRKAERAISSAAERILIIENGKPIYDPLDFDPELRLQRTWLLDLDPVVHRYAKEAPERPHERAVTPISTVLSTKGSQRASEPACKEAVSKSIDAPPEESVEVNILTKPWKSGWEMGG